ncbi:A-kinase anchor protein 8-like isoform X2 [Antechinus flavipes]|uniref:A-kinase anchor protein 8-like isoform X2 n=1 Tax=Antechinus flavipes TaxID=38775 RepID=UPI002235E530|nr:A-kinase anchor protein 8-like isoform X2 [Antechinus flavipes]
MSYTGFVQGSETTLQSTFSDTTAQPTCDYGYGTWNSGTNRGYENYSYGYGYGQDNTTNYGYGMASSNSWEIPNSDTNTNPNGSASTGTDNVLSKINQRFDVVSHLETDMMQGALYGSSGDRYDSYEAYDSRAALSDRDLYRSGYDYSEIDPEMEMAYEGHYDAYRDHFRVRDAFGQRAQGWARDGRTNRPMATGYGRMWDDPMGTRGQCVPGSSRLPSLFSQNIIPEYGMFQSMRGSYGNMQFGFGLGSGMKQMRRTWKTWATTDFRNKKKKRKQSNSTDEPDSKATKTDGSENSDSDNDEGTEGETVEGTEASDTSRKDSRAEGEEGGKEDGKEEGKEDNEKVLLSGWQLLTSEPWPPRSSFYGSGLRVLSLSASPAPVGNPCPPTRVMSTSRTTDYSGGNQSNQTQIAGWQEDPRETEETTARPHGGKGPPNWCLPPTQTLALAGSSSAKPAPGPWALQTKLFPWPRYGRQRIQFVCSLCKYRTFYDDEMTNHLDSKFHKEHFKFVGTKLPKQTADFLQEYVANKTKKTEERRKTIEDLNGVIQQIYKDQDLTQEIAMEHFMKKVEAAHCAACDLFIPMQFGIIQKHLKSMEHNRNRRLMMEQSKKSSLMVARSILNNKLISKKLERYLKGENPFTDDPEEEKEQEEGEGSALEEGAAEGEDENATKEKSTAGEPELQSGDHQPPEVTAGAGEQIPSKNSVEEQSALELSPEEEPLPLLGGALQQQIRGIPGLDVEADEDEG